MKKGIIALGLMASTFAAAQDIYKPGEGEGIVYFLPKTALQVNIIATKVTQQPGEFCQYANRYLRLNDVSSQPSVHWEIKQIDVRSIGVPDSTKAYIMKLKDKNVASNVELTENGIVKAINTTAPKEENEGYQLEKPAAHENARKYMTEEILMAGSTAKMAELTAKEIYNIRESKNLITRGQADNMPKDGAAMKLMMSSLDKQEKALMEMFTGTSDREDKVFSFLVTPEENLRDQIAARFSRQKKKGNGILYNIPGKGNVTVSYNGKEVFKGELPVTQFGYTETLVDGLFDKKINTRVIFNPNTGGVVKIDKD